LTLLGKSGVIGGNHMARRRGQQVNQAQTRRRDAQAQRREAPVVHEEEDSQAALQRHQAFLRQQVSLKNGVKMELGTVESVFGGLEDLLEENPRAFATLVALVRPKGATRVPEKVSAKDVEDLKKWVVLGPGDVPTEEMAAVLDASYLEEAGRGLLRDPVIYPNFQFAAEREALREEANSWVARSPQLRRALDNLEKRAKDQDEGPALG
jgi:hypothetical protein